MKGAPNKVSSGNKVIKTEAYESIFFYANSFHGYRRCRQLSVMRLSTSNRSSQTAMLLVA